MSSPSDAIFAVSTPPAPAPRAVVRMSGPELLAGAGRALPPGLPRPRGRREALVGELEWLPGCRVPAALLVLPGPASSTGEDVLEIHLPGATPVVEAVLETLRRAGLRPAEPGEFTRRACRHGRLDLVQAEAVLALVHARSAAAARAAAAVLAGSLGRSLEVAREALVAASAELEARLDFEEGDAADLRPDEVAGWLRRARRALEEGLRGEERRRLLPRAAPRIGLLGAPNAGKSTLFACLSGQPALVDATPGTTRDRREALWQAPGSEEAWLLVDGPGEGGTVVDPRDAAARRLEPVAPWDLCWWLADASDPAAVLPPSQGGVPALVVWTKTDRVRRVDEARVARTASRWPMVWVSARLRHGLDELAAATSSLLRDAEEDRAATAAAGFRHRAALREALECVAAATALEESGAGADLVAEELRRAVRALEVLTGSLAPEDLLDRIFSRFCIGK